MDELIVHLKRDLEAHEGKRKFPYDDKTGRPPILAKYVKNKLEPTEGRITIGIGRNLSDVGLSDGEIETLLDADIRVAIQAAIKLFPGMSEWSLGRQRAVVNLVFNMGVSTLLKFRRTIRAIRAGDWALASTEIMNSKWARHDVAAARSSMISRLLRDG